MINKMYYPKADVDRLYLPRSIEDWGTNLLVKTCTRKKYKDYKAEIILNLYNNKPLPLIDTNNITISWDFPVQIYRSILVSRPENKKGEKY